MSESLLFYYLIIWQPLGYILGALGMLIEGDITWFTLSFLTSQGFFNLWAMLIVVFVGLFISDTFFFYIGRWIKYMPKFVIVWSEKIAKPFDRHTVNKPARTLFISKFTYLVHKPILIRMGMVGKTYREFILADLPAIIFWMIIVGSLGYFSGLSFFLLRQYLRYAEVGFLVGLAVFFGAIKIVSKYTIKKL